MAGGLRKLGRITFLVIFGAALFTFTGSWVLTRTGLGQDVVLRRALDRIAGAVNGELTVGLVRSRQLLFGTSLSYARVHQEGAGLIPQREHVGLDDDTLQIFVEAVAEHALDAMKPKA